MRDEGPFDVVLLPKTIDNSQVVRELDPRSSREIYWVLLLVACLAAGLGLYAWPHFELRQSAMATERMRREREQLIEQNRKLRLEKAALEDLRRVETLAVRELGMATPAPGRLVVVEAPRPAADGAQVARGQDSPRVTRN